MTDISFKKLSAFYVGESDLKPDPSWRFKMGRTFPGNPRRSASSMDIRVRDHLLNTSPCEEIDLTDPWNTKTLANTIKKGDIVVMGNLFALNVPSQSIHIDTSRLRITPSLSYHAVVFDPEAIYFDAKITEKQWHVQFWAAVLDPTRVHFFSNFDGYRY